ncbi:hypothetical protein [Flavobacterium cerinum]|uniref:DUF3887 domain-containing protein n=1 Tax=Flavobacterium cerinum TaxID=2502784 RepID=A0ABY5IRA3_9FLAO|nr:hypothetical protein [Flavobacterium cerinum]UUC44810.1 hypothetical protein NOX80_14385 [Flavobacterium cerinum]
MKNSIIFIFIVVVLNSCNFNANIKKENNIRDKEAAESVVGFLYLYTAKKEFDSIPKLMSQDFYKLVAREDLKSYLISKKEKLGDFKDFTLKDWKTTETSGTNPKTEYLLIYDVTYSNGHAEESISLVKENNKVKIFGYNVNLKE